jgi:hypothetical protein
MWRRAVAGSLLVGAVLSALAGCASGSLSAPETSGTAVSPPAPSAPASTRVSVTGPTVIVTVPDLVPTSAPPAAAEPAPAPVDTPSAEQAPGTAAADPAPVEAPAPAAPAETAAAPPAEPAAPAPEPAAPAGEGINVSLENCEGCTVLATHRGVTGELSGALVGTGSGRAILLSVRADGSVAGVIGVPYGAAFSAPDGGVLACAQGRCVVAGRQADGRAILSAFELTDSGAWRDVSGDDAFPSATERAAVIDLGGELGIAVQDQGSGEAVWILYRWSGDRFAVAGCAADGSPPASVGAVNPDQCLS